jgi:hypothetical protein
MQNRIRVYHTTYGCDTGCCGHVIELNGRSVGDFEFSHPYGEDKKQWAVELTKVELEKYYPECLDSINWESIDYSEVSDD